jgi:mannose-6-phosphate isomerase-like protein (cupin superfamily)
MNVVLYKNFIKDLSLLPTWEEVILDLDFNFKVNEKLELKVRTFNNYGFTTHYGDNIKKVFDIKNTVHHTFKPSEPICTTHLYISFLSSSESIGMHSDNTDVYFVLAKGKMKWIIEEVKDNFVLYEMNEGDMIYIPKNVPHDPIPLSPRVGISIGFN